MCELQGFKSSFRYVFSVDSETGFPLFFIQQRYFLSIEKVYKSEKNKTHKRVKKWRENARVYIWRENEGIGRQLRLLLPTILINSLPKFIIKSFNKTINFFLK